MKKTLLLACCLILVMSSFMTMAQNRKAMPNRDKSSVANLRVQSAVAPHAVKKNGHGPVQINALSGYYMEGFEGSFPPADWQVIDVQDPTYLWEQSTLLPYAGASSAYISYTSTIGVTGEDWMIMPQFSVISTDSFSFWLAAQFIPYPPDTTYILVSTTDSMPSSFTTVLATLAEGSNYPSAAGVYQNYAYSLSAYAGQDIFVAIVNTNDYGDGVFLDNVAIGTKPGTDATSYSIDVPSYTQAGITNNPLATVLNNGSTTQTFDVTMTISGGYTSTKTVTSLGAGATQQVTFDPWTPVAGVYTVTTQTLLVGDVNPNDDTLSSTVNVLEPFANYGWISGADMATAYFDPAAAALNTNDTSYLFHLGGASSVIAADADMYAPYNNTWTSINALNTGAYVAGAAGVNNKVYFIGGYNPNFTPLADNQVYDMATGTWGSGSSMPIPVGDFAVGIYNNNYIYCIAGFDGTNDQDAVQIYNTATDTWTSGTAFPYASAGLRGGIVGNKIVVSGGYSQTVGAPAANTYVGTIDAANPSNITWTQVADYPSGPISRHGGGGSLITASGLVVFTGGDPLGTGVEARTETFGFDVNSNTWKIGPAKPTGANNICNLAAVVNNDSLYLAAIGGYDGANALAVNEWLNLGAYQIPSGIIENGSVYSFSVNPNPVVETATISLSLKQSANVKAIITDVLGNELAVLCDKNLSQGKHKLNWDASTFVKGVYFCNLTTDGKTFTQKIVKF